MGGRGVRSRPTISQQTRPVHCLLQMRMGCKSRESAVTVRVTGWGSARS